MSRLRRPFPDFSPFSRQTVKAETSRKGRVQVVDGRWYVVGGRWGKSRIQVSGFRIQGRSAGPGLWTCGSSKAGVGRAGFKCQVPGDRGSRRIQESEVRSENERHGLSAFCFLLSAFCFLPSARRLDIKGGALGWLECWHAAGKLFVQRLQPTPQRGAQVRVLFGAWVLSHLSRISRP